MIFEPLSLAGAFRIRLEKSQDVRGYYARTFCVQEFAKHGLHPSWMQCSISYNRLRGTLRGLHWQVEPHVRDKLVRAAGGAIWDVMVDLRPDSPTFKQWHGETLDEDNGVTLYIPGGFAHGFVTLSDNATVFYHESEIYEPASALGARFDDPAFGIRWPITEGLVVSERDLAFPPFNPEQSQQGHAAA